MSWIDVNGTRIYHELRGSGPAVLLVSGATGDAGHWTDVAEALASDYTVVTYDRRGNSRSPRPAGWATTTIDEQADDAAGLLGGLDLAPAVVVGTSAGAGIVVTLALRRPEVLRGVLLHEPIFESGVSNAAAVRAGRRALIEEGMAKGGLRTAAELFVRSVAGDDVYEMLDPQLRERLLGNGEVLFDIELAAFLGYGPTPEQLSAIRMPRAVTAGADNRDPSARGHWRYESARSLADRLGTPFVELPGAHMAYLGQPRDFADALRPLLEGLVRAP